MKEGSDPQGEENQTSGNKRIRISFIFESFTPRAVTGNKSRELPGALRQGLEQQLLKQTWLGNLEARLLVTRGGMEPVSPDGVRAGGIFLFSH